MVNSLAIELGLIAGEHIRLVGSRHRASGPAQSVYRAVEEMKHRPGAISKIGSRYPEAAVTLFRRAQSSHFDKSLSYLAYYQLLEYFFPVYSRKDLLDKIKNTIKDPRFNKHSDVDVGRLVYLVEHDSLTRASEREQLAGVIGSCISGPRLMRHLRNETIRKYLADKESLPEVPTINPTNANIPLSRQIASRIYSIRCKIVHTKDGVTPGILDDILLVGGSALMVDLYLIEEIAKDVLAASGEPLNY
ncbi:MULTISPECIES: hypothetical protein [Parafrankia]|uniref:hypothetical protein n=1 Tax=Parafrankia TaxID=2994362 RepID=UPI001042354A|nr:MULTISPECIES: hypothetical protein [Parafrankia]MBE3203648.1 hypothetical protein [Parafrankia sp. CH37]